MFRRRNQGGGDLPMTMGGGGPAPSSGGFQLGVGSATSEVDGSAKSIHLQSPILKKWKDSSPAVKITYMVTLISFFCVIFGWRSLSYYSSKVYLECSTTECNVLLRGIGRQRPTKLNVPRHQILGAYPVKVNADGKVIKHKVNINEEWKYERSKKKKTNYNNYKGPDKDGNYLSYVIELQDLDPNDKPKQQRRRRNNRQSDEPPKDLEPDDDGWKDRAVDQADSIDLKPILPFCEPATDDSGDNAENKYHIVMRQHGIAQTRRRVRNMVQKIDSYAKKRRHKLSVKESTSPHWKGVLMMVLGGVVFLLSILLGMFWEGDDAMAQGGPGARRMKQHQHPQNGKRSSGTSQNINPYQRTTPTRYEVSTKPKKPSTKIAGGGGSMRRRS